MTGFRRSDARGLAVVFDCPRDQKHYAPWIGIGVQYTLGRL
jgi:hypothetical protein